MNIHHFNYIGPSMNPTLRAGDGLIVLPYGQRPIKKGDMVVFKSPHDDQRVVHRVIAISPQGIQTRGDNNRLVDPYLLRPEDILGRVVEVRRGSKKIITANGLSGYSRFQTLQVKRIMLSILYRILTIPYRPMQNIRLNLIRSRKIQVITFTCPTGQEQILRWGKTVIGRRRNPNVPWQIKALYRQIIRTPE